MYYLSRQICTRCYSRCKAWYTLMWVLEWLEQCPQGILASTTVAYSQIHPTHTHTHSDQEMVHSIVERLGRFHCVKTVCESTSHVVCGSPRRTVNVLSAILRGCWIVSLDWVGAHKHTHFASYLWATKYWLLLLYRGGFCWRAVLYKLLIGTWVPGLYIAVGLP